MFHLTPQKLTTESNKLTRKSHRKAPPEGLQGLQGLQGPRFSGFLGFGFPDFLHGPDPAPAQTDLLLTFGFFSFFFRAL